MSIAALPDGRYLQLATMLGKREILAGLEKTAEISTKLYARESAIVETFYKLAFYKYPVTGDTKSMIKIAGEALSNGGKALALATNLSANIESLQETFSRLEKIGQLNAKLQIATSSQELSLEAREHAASLGSENSRFCLETLQDLVKCAENIGSNSSGIASDTDNSYGGKNSPGGRAKTWLAGKLSGVMPSGGDSGPAAGKWKQKATGDRNTVSGDYTGMGDKVDGPGSSASRANFKGSGVDIGGGIAKAPVLSTSGADPGQAGSVTGGKIHTRKSVRPPRDSMNSPNAPRDSSGKIIGTPGVDW